jgi:hypothetical protein
MALVYGREGQGEKREIPCPRKPFPRRDNDCWGQPFLKNSLMALVARTERG